MARRCLHFIPLIKGKKRGKPVWACPVFAVQNSSLALWEGGSLDWLSVQCSVRCSLWGFLVLYRWNEPILVCNVRVNPNRIPRSFPYVPLPEVRIFLMWSAAEKIAVRILCGAVTIDWNPKVCSIVYVQ
jgi:hypothetical protein